MSNRIHVLIDGEQFGPYPESEFRQHVAARKILRSDLVWREGLADWVPASQLLDHETARAAGPSTTAAISQPIRGSDFERTRVAAEKGDPEAQFRLSAMLFAGHDARNDAEAADWLRRAAESGHGDAQHALGFLDLDGFSR